MHGQGQEQEAIFNIERTQGKRARQEALYRCRGQGQEAIDLWARVRARGNFYLSKGEGKRLYTGKGKNPFRPMQDQGQGQE